VWRMQKTILMIAMVALVGCGKKEDGNTGVVNPNLPSPKAAAEADTPPVPTIITNVVTNVLKEVVTNIVTAQPPAASSTAPPVLEPEEMLANRLNELLRLRQVEMNRRSPPEPLRPKIEKAIRSKLKKPTGGLGEGDEAVSP